MNDPFVIGQAAVWADRVLADQQSQRQRLRSMVERAHGHPPSDQQLTRLEEFLKQQAAEYGAEDKRVWADLGHTLWNMKSFYYLR